MRTTCSSHHSILDLNTLLMTYLVKSKIFLSYLSSEIEWKNMGCIGPLTYDTFRKHIITQIFKILHEMEIMSFLLHALWVIYSFYNFRMREKERTGKYQSRTALWRFSETSASSTVNWAQLPKRLLLDFVSDKRQSPKRVVGLGT